MSENLLRRLGRHFLDVDATSGTGHEHRPFRRTIDDDADVGFAGDVSRGGNENFLDGKTLDRELEDLGGDCLRLLGCLRQLYSARLATATGVNLGLDDDGRSKFAGDLFRLLRRRCNLTGRDRDAVLPEDFLCLVLVDVHSCSESVRYTRIVKWKNTC